MKLNTRFNVYFNYNNLSYYFEDLDVFNLSTLMNLITDLGVSYDCKNFVVTFKRNGKKITNDNFNRIYNLDLFDEV